MATKASESSRLKGKAGAWMEMQMEKFERQNRRRMRRQDNMERHAKKQAEKMAQTEKSWNDKMKRKHENAQRKRDALKLEKKIHKKAAYAKLREKVTTLLEANKSKRSPSNKDEKVRLGRQRKAEIMQLKAVRARKKEKERYQQRQNLRFAEEKKMTELRTGWAAKEKRQSDLQEQEQKKRHVRKLARQLLVQTKRDQASHKASLDPRRVKAAAKIQRQNKMSEFIEDLEGATNEELKEHARLEWIHKQRLKQAKWDSKVHNRSEQTYMDSFPSISMYRSGIKETFDPIITEMSQRLRSEEKAMMRAKGLFPGVPTPRASRKSQTRKSKSRFESPKSITTIYRL